MTSISPNQQMTSNYPEKTEEPEKKTSLRITAGQTGLPWLTQDANAQSYASLPQQSPSTPPPKFTARGRTLSTIRLPTRKRTMQQQIYSMKDGLDPVKVLIQRLTNWQISVKYLISIFNRIKKAESNTGESYRKMDAKFEFPAKIKGQFKSTNGVQDAWLALRQYTRENSLVHRDYVDFIENEIIPILKSMLKEIHHMMQTIKKDKSLHTGVLWERRKLADKVITRLNDDIYLAAKVQEKPKTAFLLPKKDPLLTKYIVIQTIKDLYKEENRLHKAFLETQEKYRQFEQEKIVAAYTELFQTFETFRVQHKLETLESVSKIASIFNSIEADAEWKDFTQKHDNEMVTLIAAYKDEDQIDFPNSSHPLIQPLFADKLSRQQKKKWIESYYVLSPTGFLYRYKHENDVWLHPTKPEIKMFVPQCTILAHPDNPSVFQIKGKLLNSFFKSKVAHELSSSDPNTVHIFDTLTKSQTETSESLKAIAPPLENHSKVADEAEPCLDQNKENMQSVTEQEVLNKASSSSSNEKIQENPQLNISTTNNTASSDHTSESSPTTPNNNDNHSPSSTIKQLGITQKHSSNNIITHQLPAGGPTREGSDIFWDTAAN